VFLVGGLIGGALGGLAGFATAELLDSGLGSGLLTLAGIVVGILIAYVVANATSGSTAATLTRSLLVGLNSGLNLVFAATIYRELLGVGGLVFGVAVGVINLLAIFDAVSTSEFYQGVLGWLNWFMPMSWLIVGLGAVFFLLNVVGHMIGYLIFRGNFFRLTGVDVDLKTGTFFVKGGCISNANPIDTAFNMGNFALVDNASSNWHVEHEAGHTLNLGAFGSVFHLIGAVDENVTGGGTNAYSERIAESNDPATTQSNIIPMWT
jgi:hypothetical protein